MYIEHVPNRDSPPAILLRESYREGARVRKRTLANLSKWPASLVEGLRVLLRGGSAVEALKDAFEVSRSRPHGHVMAALATIRRLKLEQLLDPVPSRARTLVLAMVAARIIEPRSKLATARALDPDTLTHSLAEELALEQADEQALYAAMDWLLERQAAIEQHLAERHLQNGTLVLYDVSSTYFEGRSCPLAQLGYSRDDKHGKLQIVFGLLCNRAGCPIAVEVFEGNRADPRTLSTQIEKLRSRFGLAHVVLVGDRGMLTEARIREELKPAGWDWVSALRAPAIKALVQDGTLQLSLFDQQDLAEILSEDYPGERLIVCRNPLLGEERARKREALLKATEQKLDLIVAATARAKRALRGQAKIALRVARVLNQFKVAKHFELEITAERFTYQRNAERIAAESALDGLYVIRTSVSKETLNATETVRAYKDLASVERAFRSFKSIDLKVRPIYHHLAKRVRAHVFLCMLAYYVQWHMRERLAPLLFDEDDAAGAQAARSSIVAPAQPSPSSARKAGTKRTAQGHPVHSFRTLLDDLATIVKNRIQPTLAGAIAFDQITRPTPLQQRAFDLLGVRL
jgi:transposase